MFLCKKKKYIQKKKDSFSFYHFLKQYILSSCAALCVLFWSSVTAAAFKWYLLNLCMFQLQCNNNWFLTEKALSYRSACRFNGQTKLCTAKLFSSSRESSCARNSLFYFEDVYISSENTSKMSSVFFTPLMYYSFDVLKCFEYFKNDSSETFPF